MGINLKRTFISTEDFLKLVATAKHLHVLLLNVECYMKISDLAIFKAKVYLGRLRSINISFKEQYFIDRSFCCLFMLLQLCKSNPCKLKGTQARRKRTIVSGEDFPSTWKWTNRYIQWKAIVF